jgi:hypothetical protein
MRVAPEGDTMLMDLMEGMRLELQKIKQKLAPYGHKVDPDELNHTEIVADGDGEVATNMQLELRKLRERLEYYETNRVILDESDHSPQIQGLRLGLILIGLEDSLLREIPKRYDFKKNWIECYNKIISHITKIELYQIYDVAIMDPDLQFEMSPWQLDRIMVTDENLTNVHLEISSEYNQKVFDYILAELCIGSL